ncbi:hypothetical protein QF022_001508 [Vogesella perlucida]|nr:hypothetical protein [Vogesella perlucida]
MGIRIITALLAALLAAQALAQTSVTLSYAGDALVYDGELSAAANQRLFALYDAATVKPHTLVISSSGGAFNLGLALGEWVAQHRLRVHVPRYCNSACANYVFTAASQRELGYHAVLAFHGGMDVADRQRSAYLARFPPQRQAEARQRFAAEVKEARQRELAFFARIGVDSAITSYGYHRFPRIMRQYKAWSYSLPMLRRFGVGPISISDNERWLPRPADDGLLMIVAPQRYGCLPAGRVTDLLYDCVTDQPLPLSVLGD